ncbi:MAG: glycogen synthase GlgA [Sulfurimicrobium sp.]|nr:glycogen synthase GlgA [Sulfurimicrobium sp.]MDZ7654709.1 glycogen synthase GlgA [Sulfurimicrobium sp.]
MPLNQTLKILFITPEITPLLKTGGLADVSAALPAALREHQVDVRVLLPGYPRVMDHLDDKRSIAILTAPGVHGEIRILGAELPGSGVPLLVIDYPLFYERDGGPYIDHNGHDWVDNAQRFALLSRVGAILGSSMSPLDWRPDIVQCNDWQSGLTPAYLHFSPEPSAATIMTIHNMAFQGTFPSALTIPLGLPASSYDINGVEYFGQLSFLKAGLFYANHITTVSPTYAEEIQQEPLGFGMQGLLAHRYLDLTGIVNGIDGHEWNPATDKLLAHNYSADNLAGKAANKRALQHKLGLTENPDIPLLGVISRLTHQKGLDLLPAIAPFLLEYPVQIVILGSGEAGLEESFLHLAQSHPDQVAAVIGFNETLSHQIEAGADIFLMPSRFEPCGLNQMYSQCYGTPPIVHATGGLVDTVVDATPENITNGTATGFIFRHTTTHGLNECIHRALDLFRDQPDIWRKIQANGMRRDFSWNRSAEEYMALYEMILKSA